MMTTYGSTMGRAWMTKCSNFHPNSLPQETRQEIPHDPSQKDMEAAANQSTLPFLQWSKPKEMIAAPFAEGIVSVHTFNGLLTVYCLQSTVNLHQSTCKRPQLFANRCCSASKKHQGPAQPHEIKEK